MERVDLGPTRLGGLFSLPDRPESAISGHSPTVAERLLNTESGHPEDVRDRRALTHSRASLDLPNRLELGPEFPPGVFLFQLLL